MSNELSSIVVQVIASIPYCVIVLVAIFVSIWRQNANAKEQQKISTFSTLAATRGHPMPLDVVQAFNRIPVEFRHKKYAAVQTAWRACVISFNTECSQQTRTLLIDTLVSELAKSLGYSSSDVALWYRPSGDSSAAVETELLRKQQLEETKAAKEFYETTKASMEEAKAIQKKALAQIDAAKKQQQEKKNGVS